MKLFVPGRICLFGEHTDWAGGYRRDNPDLEKGACLIVGTNQGLYADVEMHADQLILTSTLEDGNREGPISLKMDSDTLLQCASQKSFFSYAAGVAYELLQEYPVSGLKINNYLTDLPVKKGLSSSAAMCVLVARAFNRIYNLSLTIDQEMELAYRGELRTGSQCGRMDQGCAYGSQPILMIFDGDDLSIRPIDAGTDFHFVIVDLNAEKNTRTILQDLNTCYPVAQNQQQQKVQSFLGPISAGITHHAVKALRSGDTITLGALMSEAQHQFDEHVAPACPHELTAPVLHNLLAYPPLQPFILGGKGIGSQGDGSAQFLVKNSSAARSVIEIIEKDLKMPCLALTIPGKQRVRKAVIPAAGFGTRLFPVTKTLKKEFFPVIDASGEVKPVILAIVEEAVSAGIDEICLVVQESDIPLFREFFHEPPSEELESRLSGETRKISKRILELGQRIRLIPQKTQDGFGHAVQCAADFVGKEPFLLMLGDHLFRSTNGNPCARQAIELFLETGKSVVGLQTSSGESVQHFGTATGHWEDGTQQVLNITEFAEKPNREYARQSLTVEGLADDTYLTLFGMYVLKPGIFSYLERNISANYRERGEFQLTSCLDELREADGFRGFIVQGERFDMGHPEAYLDTILRFSRNPG